MNKSKIGSVIVILILSVSVTFCGKEKTPEIITYVTVKKETGKFLAWPANNGLWNWQNNEIVVGYTKGTFTEIDGHNVEAPYHNELVRSLDGGYTWEKIDETGFIALFDPDGKSGNASLELTELNEPLDFSNEHFILRIISKGYRQPDLEYHGENEPAGGFFYSYDRGTTWNGPVAIHGLSQDEELQGMEITSRTSYLIQSGSTALVFMSARVPGVRRTDKPFVARTSDGGLSFKFLGWIVTPDDPYRAVMPSVVETTSGKLVSAIRRRAIDNNDYCWIDIYTSVDDGKIWNFTSRAAETGIQNGNPPALIQLTDERLLLAYANREHLQILARFSSDDGITWGPELVLREGNERDIGYPVMVQNNEGNIVTIYYWADTPDSEIYIEAVIWNPGNKMVYSGPKKLDLPKTSSIN